MPQYADYLSYYRQGFQSKVDTVLALLQKEDTVYRQEHLSTEMLSIQEYLNAFDFPGEADLDPKRQRLVIEGLLLQSVTHLSGCLRDYVGSRVQKETESEVAGFKQTLTSKIVIVFRLRFLIHKVS